MSENAGAANPSSLQWREAALVLREQAKKFDAFAEAAELAECDPWVIPLEHRPTCPADGKPCTSWTCLVDVCEKPHA